MRFTGLVLAPAAAVSFDSIHLIAWQATRYIASQMSHSPIFVDRYIPARKPQDLSEPFVDSIEDNAADSVYFEGQVGRQCGLHAVNNLLQRQAVDVETLDRVIESIKATLDTVLSEAEEDPDVPQYEFKNEHGDYQINVLEVALQDLGTLRLNQSLMACRL